MSVIRCTCQPRLGRLRIKLRRTDRGWSAHHDGWGVEVWDEPHARQEALESLRHFARLEVESDGAGGWRSTGQSAACPREVQ